MRIEEEYNCMGYFGFGNGISFTREESAYCNGCPLKDACWQMHRARVYEYFPDAAKMIDDLGKEKDGPRKIAAFVEKRGTEPFMSVMMGNMEDGVRIGTNLKVKDRGQYTLKYPFK